VSAPRPGRGKKTRDFLSASVIPRLPDCRDSARAGDAFPPDIIGAKILRFGAAPPECELEGGGLIIDYIPLDESEPKRLVLAFNELGMWIER
jgi:hypothetical protein